MPSALYLLIWSLYRPLCQSNAIPAKTKATMNMNSNNDNEPDASTRNIKNRLFDDRLILTLFFTVVPCKHLSALANAILADSAILARWITFRWLELMSSLNYHVCALNDCSKVGLEFQLEDCTMFSYDGFRKIVLDLLIS